MRSVLRSCRDKGILVENATRRDLMATANPVDEGTSDGTILPNA
jgi:hypothetical protein